MRITNRLLAKGYLADLTANLENMRKVQEQLSSGKEIRRPSDDPFRVARAMELHTSIVANERYQKNIDEALSWVNTTDTALGQFNDVLQRIRELTVSAGNGAYSQSERNAISQEIKQLKESLTEIANSTYDGRFIFGGDQTTVKPFEINGTNVNYKWASGDRGLVKEFAPSIKIDISITGSRLINQSSPPPSGDVFSTVQEIINRLDQGNGTPTDLLDDLDKHIDNVLNLRGEIGAKTNRLEAMSKKNQEENYNITELLAKTEDIDIAEKVMEYKVMETVYTAALQTGAKILQPSLVDFLR
jgi:flagellar hook-associated protein 3 FlgL